MFLCLKNGLILPDIAKVRSYKVNLVFTASRSSLGLVNLGHEVLYSPLKYQAFLRDLKLLPEPYRTYRRDIINADSNIPT